MDKHNIATTIVHCQDRLMKIKSISGSAEIDRLAMSCYSKLQELISTTGVHIYVDEIRDRKIDPTG